MKIIMHGMDVVFLARVVVLEIFVAFPSFVDGTMCPSKMTMVSN